jgi:hypothetical protein
VYESLFFVLSGERTVNSVASILVHILGIITKQAGLLDSDSEEVHAVRLAAVSIEKWLIALALRLQLLHLERLSNKICTKLNARETHRSK